jgi:hypothetical protein
MAYATGFEGDKIHYQEELCVQILRVLLILLNIIKTNKINKKNKEIKILFP